jgi:hypothetical protein
MYAVLGKCFCYNYSIFGAIAILEKHSANDKWKVSLNWTWYSKYEMNT